MVYGRHPTCTILSSSSNGFRPFISSLRDGPVSLAINQTLLVLYSSILTNASKIQIAFDSDHSQIVPVTINGELTLGGQLVLVVSKSTDGLLLPVVQATSISGQYSTIAIKSDTAERCKETSAKPTSAGASLTVVLTVRDRCKHLSAGVIAAIATGSVVAVGVLATLGLYLVFKHYPSSSLFNYHDMEGSYR